MKAFLSFSLFILVLSSNAQQTLKLHYEQSESALNNEQIDLLTIWLASLEGDSAILTISTSADTTGPNAYNERLVESRLMEVKEFLGEYPQIHISELQNLGETFASAEDGIDNLSLSRFTELELIASRKIDIVEDRVVSKQTLSNNQFLASSIVQPQKFFIDLSKKQSFTGSDGTIIEIPANSLQLENGAVFKGNATATLKEFYELDQMIAAGLNTQTNSDLLETGGMVYWDVKTISGDQLEVREGKSVFIGMPTESIKDDMRVFNLNEASDEWLEQAEDSEVEVSYIEVEGAKKYKVISSPGDVTRSQGIQTFDGYHMKKVPIYGLDVSKMNFINCDRFLKVKKTRNIELTLSNADSGKISIYLVFGNLNSIMTPSFDPKKEVYKFQGIPIKYTPILLAYRDNEAGISAASQKTVLSKSRYELTFDSTKDTLKNMLADLEDQ